MTTDANKATLPSHRTSDKPLRSLKLRVWNTKPCIVGLFTTYNVACRRMLPRTFTLRAPSISCRIRSMASSTKKPMYFGQFEVADQVNISSSHFEATLTRPGLPYNTTMLLSREHQAFIARSRAGHSSSQDVTPNRSHQR